jgi:ribosomal protein L37E
MGGKEGGMRRRSDWTDERALDEIRWAVNRAELKLDEARDIAAAQWGDKDRRTEDVKGVWVEAHSLLNASWMTKVKGIPSDLTLANAEQAGKAAYEEAAKEESKAEIPCPRCGRSFNPSFKRCLCGYVLATKEGGE